MIMVSELMNKARILLGWHEINYNSDCIDPHWQVGISAFFNCLMMHLEWLDCTCHQNVEGNGDAIMGGKMKETITKEEDHIKKTISRAPISILKRASKKKTKNDIIELGDSEDEEEISIK